MNIDLSSVKMFYNITQLAYVNNLKIEQSQKSILSELDNLKTIANTLHDKNEPWMGAILKPWESLIQQCSYDLENLSTMQAFNSQFDGLIFMVAGAVNSGKSSLGNFIAGCDFLHLNEEIPYQKENSLFSLFDSKTNQKISIDHFAEKSIECTSSIQAFELNKSFVWVDTPGLASLTPENGTLAKKYISAADLVIFVISSDAPMTQEDIKTLKSLGLDQNKPFTILITKFDEVTTWDDERDIQIPPTYIIKPDRNRKEQRQGIFQALKDHGLETLSTAFNQETIIFFSKYCARIAIQKDDPDLWIQSGAPDLFRLFNHILTNEKSQLKQLAPIENYNALLRKISEGYKSVDEESENSYSLKNILKISESTLREIKQKQNNFAFDIKNHQAQILLEANTKAAFLLRKNIGSIDSDQIIRELNKTLIDAIEKKWVRIQEDLAAIINKSILNHMQISIDMTIEDTEKTYETITYQPPPKKSNAIKKIIGTGLTVFGGGPGRVVGAVILGSTKHQSSRVDSITINIETGNNRELVIQKALNDFNKNAEIEIKKNLELTVGKFFDDTIVCLQNLQNEIVAAKSRIDSLYIDKSV